MAGGSGRGISPKWLLLCALSCTVVLMLFALGRVTETDSSQQQADKSLQSAGASNTINNPWFRSMVSPAMESGAPCPDALPVTGRESGDAGDLFSASERDGILKPFRFHVYPSNPEHTLDIKEKMAERKKHYRIEWEVAITLRGHPKHTDDPEEADLFIVPLMESFWRFAEKDGLLANQSDAVAHAFEHPKSCGDYWERFDGHDHYTMNLWFRDYKDRIPNINYITNQVKTCGNPEAGMRWEFHRNFRRMGHHYLIVPEYTITSTKEPYLVHDRPTFAMWIGPTSVNSPKNSRVRVLIKEHMEAAKREDVQFLYPDSRSKRAEFEARRQDFAANSTFCPGAPGDVDMAGGVYMAIANGCIPVLFCDWCLYAFENLVDFSKIAIFFRETQLFNSSWNFVEELARMPRDTIRDMQAHLDIARRHFAWRDDPADGVLNTLVAQLEQESRHLRRYKRWMRWRHDFPSMDNRTGYDDSRFNDF